MVFVVPPERQPTVAAALSDLVTVPVGVDFTGSMIVYRKEGTVPSPRSTP